MTAKAKMRVPVGNCASNYQVLLRDSRSDVRYRQGKKGERSPDIVVRHEPLRLVEENGEYACEGNGAHRNDHDLEEPPQSTRR
jgi:hypothetical protein